MEEEISRMKNFLTEFNNEQIQSPTSEEIAPVRVVNYALEDPEDVKGQVIDWVLNYLDNRKCPYSLALSVAKEIAQQISISFPQNEVGDAEKVPNAAAIYTEAIGKIPVVCNAFSNQANLESICSTKYATSVFAIKNKRRKMEDRHVIHHDLNALLDFKDAPHHSYYAVFDGHSGIDAACYASAHLHSNIAKHPDFLTNTPKAIIEGYQITDLNFLNKCNKWNIKSGCTAVSAIIRENTAYLSWLGDSQAVIVKAGVPVTITSPHKPDREDERKRIESLGGHVSYLGTWRVNSLLAVTRAIGDPDQKRFISSEPELTVVELDGTEDFLILACDGLWDALSPEDMTGVLYRYLAESSPHEPVEAVAAKLVHQSKLQGSEDNITAIVVFLRDIKAIKENATNFLSNPLLGVQSHDFMSMNGNVKMFNIEPNLDAPFSKPTVLELNAASSKKLKNAANVMSSAGFGSASYSYQYVENSSESSFQTTDPSATDGAENIFVSQNISASCFAPEATALSELPTPPIDDMLASQQFENFYSTDLYKELNKSTEASQSVQSVDVLSSNVDIISRPNEPSESPSVDLLSQPFTDIIADDNNMSLLDTKSNVSTNPDAEISPDEAVGIASDVVSTTIETAVKCISSNETQDDPVAVHSQLNPYAKPFVMKSFFSHEEPEIESKDATISDRGDNSLMPCEEQKKINQTSETTEEISTESNINQLLTTSTTDTTHITDESLNLSATDSPLSKHLDQPSYNNNTCDKLTMQEHVLVAENKFSEQILSPQQTSENIALIESLQDNLNDSLSKLDKSNICEPETPHDQISEENVSEITNKVIFQEENKLSDISDFQNKTSEIVNIGSESSLVIESIQTDVMNILPSSEEIKDSNLCPLSSENSISQSKTFEQESFVTQSVTNFKETVSEQNQNFNVDNSLVDLTFEKITPECESKYETVEKEITESESTSVLNVQVEPHVETTKQALTTETSVHIINSTDSTKPELNQNSDFSNTSGSLNSENTVSFEAEIKSKCEEIQKCIVEAVEKSGIAETSNLKEPVSLITIKDELIPTEAEVPSAEDSRVETVAVDLKSLPEGIPEAEGVTEDIDSDSEKDGGWSYMKGNTVSSSKSKPDEKASKTAKISDIKSNTAFKVKRDVSKPNVDIKSKVKNAAMDKTKSTVADKSKNVSDKTKILASMDKSKTPTALDKTKTSTALDKTKTPTALDKTKTPTALDKTKTPTALDKTKTPTSIDKTKAATAVDKNKKIALEKKPDAKTRVMKSSTLTATSTTKVTHDRASKITAVSSIKKETSETQTKTTSTITKSTKPTTLLRTNVSAARPGVSSVSDRSTASNKIAVKPKVGVASCENKTGVKNVNSSALSKGQTSTQSKTSSVSTRTVQVRPTSTVPSKTSTITKSTLMKSTVGEPKQKQPTSTAATTMRKPLASARKADVKEIKDSVNKEILAKKTTTTRKVETSSTLANRRVMSANNKSAIGKVSGIASKSEISKGNLSKASPIKSMVRSAESKVSSNTSKSNEKIVESVKCKIDETKNSLNVESDQKNVSEIVQVTEEKFILEASNKEKVTKESGEISNEQVIVENGSLINPITPEIETPPVECTPESLL